jgi:D-3-phosphoglycerate dehydrogenase
VRDAAVVACALAPETRGLIYACRLALMKRGALLINVAPSRIIDEDALYAALKDGRIGGGALDVRGTPFSSASPRAKRSRLAATAFQHRSAVASEELEQCGVISTFGSSWNGRRDGLRSGSAEVG